MSNTKAGWGEKKEAINRRKKGRLGRQGWGSGQRLRRCTLKGGELILKETAAAKCSWILRSWPNPTEGSGPAFPFHLSGLAES